jgi:hypothetical protein
MTEPGGYVVIGGTSLARQVCASLLHREQRVRHLVDPDDEELRKAMRGIRCSVGRFVWLVERGGGVCDGACGL